MRGVAQTDKEARFTALLHHGYRSPAAMMADNDLALGRIVDAVSHSRFWRQTATFVGDDSQGGERAGSRTVALVVSPYACRRRVDSTFYSTASMLRTIELLLGLKPLSRFDAAARPMTAAFAPRADMRPYRAVVPRQALDELNPDGGWGEREFAVGLGRGLMVSSASMLALVRRPWRVEVLR